MKRIALVLASSAFFAACAFDHPAVPPGGPPNDMLYRASFTLVSDSCNFAAIPKDGWLSNVDLYQRFDGTFDLSLDAHLPTSYTQFAQIAIAADGAVEYQTPPSDYGIMTKPQTVVGYVDSTRLDLKITRNDLSPQGECQSVFTLQGVPRALHASASIDGLYRMSGTIRDTTCPGADPIPPDSAEPFALNGDILPIADGRVRMTISGSWFEPKLADFASGWKGLISFPDGFGGTSAMAAVVTGHVGYDGIDIAIDLDASQDFGPGCVTHYRMTGAKLTFDPADLANDYRSRTVWQTCDGKPAQIADAPMSIFAKADGTYDLFDSQGNETIFTRAADGSLTASSPYVVEGDQLTYTVLSTNPLHYTVVDSYDDGFSTPCVTTQDTTAVVRFASDDGAATASALTLAGPSLPVPQFSYAPEQRFRQRIARIIRTRDLHGYERLSPSR